MSIEKSNFASLKLKLFIHINLRVEPFLEITEHFISSHFQEVSNLIRSTFLVNSIITQVILNSRPLDDVSFPNILCEGLEKFAPVNGVQRAFALAIPNKMNL
jgi:hypothetical protein